jgi:hypothetical protein
MGKKSTSRAAEAALTESTERALGLSEKLERQTEPARTIPIQKYRQLVSGDPEATTQALAPQIQGIRQQFGSARGSIERSLPRGGTLEQARGDLARAEAGTVGSLGPQLFQESLARLASLGVFGTQAGIGSLGTAMQGGSALTNLSQVQGSQGFGGMMGSLMGGK